MRALLSIEPGVAGLRLADHAMPEPGPGDLRVRVRAAGLNYPDMLMLEDRYQVKKERPFVPGQEVAGEVEAVGSGVTAFRPGDRVFGFASSGGLAEYALVPAAFAVAMPAEMSFADGSCFNGSYATGYHALVQRAHLAPGESLLVLSAAGGTGLAMVQIGAALGARVIAAASSQDKVDFAKQHGAERGLVYARDMGTEESKAFGAELKALEKRGIDIVADIVGGPYAEPAIRALAWKGRFLVIGFPAGIPKIAANLLLLKGADAVGVFTGAFYEREPEEARKNLDALIALYVEGKIRPHVSELLPLERAGEGIAMLDNRTVKGKLVVTL
jgi:NADPH2:quinone reductase